MDSNVKIDNRFFANFGAIGRRDYFLNVLILGLIVFALTAPINYYMTTNIFSLSNIQKINILFLKAPIWMICLYMLAAAFQIVIGISNAKRRITDIYGKENDVFKYIFSAIIIFNSISYLFQLTNLIFIQVLYTAIYLFLLFKKGKITSELPYDVTKLFNFGAFFGTWIWGLFNKVYYPLWYLVLLLTPFSGFFALYCGLKGNEWALRAKKYDSVEEFNSKQETQGIVFAIISLFLIPTLIFVLYFVMIIFIIASAPSDKVTSAFNKMQNYFMDATFEKCTFEKDKNVCYVYNDVWKNSDYKEKTDIMEFAAQTATEKKNATLSSDDYKNKTYKTDELKKTKIYSQDGKQLLAEFNLDEEAAMSKDFKKSIRAFASAYKFYPISK